jgi:hypothetical protein
MAEDASKTMAKPCRPERPARPPLEEIRSGLGTDCTLADVIRRYIREGIDRYQKKES